MTAANANTPERVQQRPAEKRACLGGGGSFRPAEMLKFVAGDDGGIYLDVRQKLARNGAYVSPAPAAIRKAIADEAISTALDVPAIKDVAAFKTNLAALLEKRFFERAGLDRKAGQGVLGTAKAADVIRSGTATHLFYAADIAANTLKKLETPALRAHLPFVAFATKAQWEAAFDKANCTVLAVTDKASGADLALLAAAARAFKES